MKKNSILAFLFLVLFSNAEAQFKNQKTTSANKGYAISNIVKDRFVPSSFNILADGGYLYEKMKINREKRLLQIDVESILTPYKKRPGVQQWTGEHIGKFIHATALQYQTTGDTALKRRMDYAANSLIATQLADGYLGTYLDKDRWTSWDVWSHKYNMVGLLAYYRVTGHKPALESSKKMGDLLCRTFGKGKNDIIESGTHVGMAATSILEPMVELYRLTGESRYLDFCNYIVSAWEQDNGPKIVSGLLTHGSVFKIADGKAYEMMANLVGLLEMYKLTGTEKYLTAVQNAWLDISTKRLYVHGSTSHDEHFRDDFILDPSGIYNWNSKFRGPAEGCVTVTWMQINLLLLKLTGEQKYAQQLETTMYNALFPAQNPNNGEVCYYLPLNGRKRYGEVSHGILPDISCCASSVPRGIALIPSFSAGTINNSPTVILYSSGSYKHTLFAAKKTIEVELVIKTDFPVSGKIDIAVKSSKKTKYAVLLNVPAWADDFIAEVQGIRYMGKAGTFLFIEREWGLEDHIEVNMGMPLMVLPDNNKGSRLVAVKRGPQVLALDDNIEAVNGLPAKRWIGNQIFRFDAKQQGLLKTFMMIPLADAGQSMADYKVLIDSIQIVP